MSGDHIGAQGAQGFVNNPQGAVTQQYGDENNINAGGGDVAQGNIDKRNINIINIIAGSSNQDSQSNLVEQLRAILANVDDLNSDGFMDAVKSAYQKALPTDAAAHPVKTNDTLSELEDRRVLPKFIEDLAANSALSDTTRTQLNQLISDQGLQTRADRADTTSKKRLRSFLIVVLRPEPNLQFCVNAWLIPDDSVKGSSRFCSLDINEEKKGVVCSLNDIPSVVRSLLDQSLQHLFGKDYELTIEFFLPIDYLSTEVDRLEVIPDPLDCDEFNPLGIQYKVLVRSYERLDNTYLLHNFQQWKNNWNRADINFKVVPSLDSFEHLTTVNSCNWKKLAMDLKAKLGIKITCIPPELERKNIIKAILKSAIPIAVWMRKDIRECDRESKLDCLLTSGNLETLPEYIRKEREEAYICDDPEEHFGNHLVLLWEDPNRLTPDVMARLLPTGQ
jgi:hypothetical protein